MIAPLCAGLGGLLALLWLAAPSGAEGFDEAQVRAMLFAREEAAASGEPLVLFGWHSFYNIKGNGRREIQEHQVWFIGDPDHPTVRELSPLRVLQDTEVESFGLRLCRIYRGADTLFVQGKEWSRQTPRGWPEKGGAPWAEVVGELPKLKSGDVLEVAYVLDNEWTRFFLPSDWYTVPITTPLARTIERKIEFKHPSAIEGQYKVANHSARLRRHYGAPTPRYDLHAGHLPIGPAIPTGLDAPRVYFTSSRDWRNVSGQLELLYDRAIVDGERMSSVVGDSLAREVRETRARLDAVMGYLDERLARLPLDMTRSRYYPRGLRVVEVMGGADPIERGLMLTGLSSSAHMSVDLFLARADTSGFLPEVPTAGQFDHVVLRALIAEEDETVWIDADAPTLEEGIERAARYNLVLATGGQDEPLLRRGPEGSFIPYAKSGD